MHALKKRRRLIFSQGLVLKLPRIPLRPSGPEAPLKNKIYYIYVIQNIQSFFKSICVKNCIHYHPKVWGR